MQYISLYVSYGLIAFLVLIVQNKTNLWDTESSINLDKPWKEFGYVFVSAIGVILVGQLYMAGVMFPTDVIIFESINQLLIFSPALLLLFIRHKGSSTAWLESKKSLKKILLGLCLGFIAIYIYSLIGSERSYFKILSDTYSLKNIPHLIQVLCEDILIAMLFIRLKKATSLKIALLVVSSLFAAGHIPAMISKGFPLFEFYGLFLDAGLGLFLIYTIDRTKDILWFWMVHFAMDMMQFYA